jgi:hypothetical protein
MAVQEFSSVGLFLKGLPHHNVSHTCKKIFDVVEKSVNEPLVLIGRIVVACVLLDCADCVAVVVSVSAAAGFDAFDTTPSPSPLLPGAGGKKLMRQSPLRLSRCLLAGAPTSSVYLM